MGNRKMSDQRIATIEKINAKKKARLKRKKLAKQNRDK
jgi:hypothetical protein